MLSVGSIFSSSKKWLGSLSNRYHFSISYFFVQCAAPYLFNLYGWYRFFDGILLEDAFGTTYKTDNHLIYTEGMDLLMYAPAQVCMDI